MRSLVVYTADFGGHDDPQPATPQEAPGWDVEFLRFGDADWGEAAALGWDSGECYACPPRLSGRLRGRWHKTHPHVIFPAADATVWVDARVRIKSPRFAAGLLAQAPAYWQWAALCAHPDRGTPREELEASATLGKYPRYMHEEMLTELEATGEEPGPLFATTVLVRNGGAWAQRRLDTLLWQATKAFSRSDQVVVNEQVALPHLLKICGVGAKPLELAGGGLWENELFEVGQHRRDD